MILKTKHGSGWWLRDNIKRTYYYFSPYEKVKDLPFDFIETNNLAEDSTEEVMVLHARFNDNSEELFMLFGDSFLMSDEGRNIEKIF